MIRLSEAEFNFLIDIAMQGSNNNFANQERFKIRWTPTQRVPIQKCLTYIVDLNVSATGVLCILL